MGSPLVLVRLLIVDRRRLMMENLALRHQLTVLKRSVKRPRIEDSDRMLWILLRRAFREWRDAFVFVKPDTVIRWHREGFRYYRKRKSRSKPGRPPIGMDVIHLIRRVSTDNPMWGAPRIASELVLLGHKVAESTVAKYMVKAKEPDPGQAWMTFLRNHMDVTAACDFFVAPTATFRLLYVFVVVSHARRRIVHVNVTAHPTAEWVARQLAQAFPGTEPIPQFPVHDGDGSYGWEFRRALKMLGIDPLRTAPKSPWQNCYVERVIGTLRRECTDHVIAFGESHLRRVLTEYVAYYNEARPHQSLEGNAPQPRDVEAVGELVAAPVLGGLHHRYSRAA
ncbi:MAG: integrase core domain-containing protein [Planctomycetota bacterium]